MNDNLAIFLVMVVAIGAAVVLTALTAWMRTQRRARDQGQAGEAKIEQIAAENDQLKGEVSRLEERLRALEPVMINPAERTAREIESLR